MGCSHSDESHISDITAPYESEESPTLIDKYHSKTGNQLTFHARTRIRSDDSTYNGLFERNNPSRISFSEKLEFRAYISGWSFFIKTILFKIGTYSPFRLYVYGFIQDEWVLILQHEEAEGKSINFSLFTEKSMKEGSLNKIYSAIGVRMYAPKQDHFIIEKFYLFGQLLHDSSKISSEALTMPMGHKDESTDEGEEEESHEKNEKILIDVCDQCRLTCIACHQDIDIANPGKRGYFCSSCYKSEYTHICCLCGNEMVHKNPGRLCMNCTEESIGVTQCAQCKKELPIS